jgi:hypothetical protein
MRVSKFKKKHIFCIEGNWTNTLKGKIGIQSALDFLEDNTHIRHIHKNCSTVEQLDALLKDAVLQKYKSYGIIYIAFHGHPGIIHVGKRQKISIDRIGEVLAGKARHKIIHFGSCSTLKISKNQVAELIEKTGALAISGYTKDVDFIPSTFLDMLYFQACQHYNKISLIHRDVKKYYGKMAKELGFRMYYQEERILHPEIDGVSVIGLNKGI